MKDRVVDLLAEKQARQNKNLHGGERVDGLTGRWRGVYYERGVARPRKALISPIEMYRTRSTLRLI